jgi:hypothetical protein
MTQKEIQDRYGLTRKNLTKARDIISTVRQYDYITPLTPDDFPVTGDRHAPRKIFVSDMAHGGETFAPQPNIPQAVLDVGALCIYCVDPD